jgi:hypothetical protein
MLQKFTSKNYEQLSAKNVGNLEFIKVLASNFL